MTPITLSASMRERRFYRSLNIEAAEAHYNARYVGEFPGKTKHGWTGDSPVAVFYVAEPKAPYTNNYLCLYLCPIRQATFVSDADYVKGQVFSGLRQSDGVIYSTYRHDHRSGEKGVFVDGGWDYFRCGYPDRAVVEQVRMTIVDGQIMELDADEHP